MRYLVPRLQTREIAAFLFFMIALWIGGTSAAQPANLGYAETVIGGELVLAEEKCTFRGLGTGYVLNLLNPRGRTIGRGCAMTNALPPELGMIMVQWGASPVHGAESYRIDDFTWTKRGRAVMASVLKARHDALVRKKAKEDEMAKENAAAAAMVAAFNNPGAGKTYLGVAKSKGYRPSNLISPKPCRVMVEEPDSTVEYHGVMVWKSGRTVLGLSSDGERVVQNGCALPNNDGSITVMWDYKHDLPERFAVEQISWEPKGQEWIDTETAKNGNLD